MRIDPADLRIFACVADTCSFREAAAKLHRARSSVSKRIGELERELGVVLFNRSTRRISLTDAGQTLYCHWQSIAADIDKALAAVQGVDQHPSGTLRVSVPSSLGAALMPALVQSFLTQWPDLRMSVDFRERYVDVVGKGFDAVIRFASRLPDSRLTARRLATTPRVLAASPAYLARHGWPTRLQDLRQHQCLGLGYRSERNMNWSFTSDNGPVDICLQPAFAANNDLALILSACLAGGILCSPRLLIESEIRLGRLQVIPLEDAVGPDVGVFAVYPQSRPPAKVRVFVEFVESCFDKLADTDRWAPLRDTEVGESLESLGHPQIV